MEDCLMMVEVNAESERWLFLWSSKRERLPFIINGTVHLAYLERIRLYLHPTQVERHLLHPRQNRTPKNSCHMKTATAWIENVSAQTGG